MTTFQIGKTYSARSICDYDCIFSWTVVSRTAKFLTLNGSMGKRRAGVFENGGVEHCRPLGRYSMSPVIHADQ